MIIRSIKSCFSTNKSIQSLNFLFQTQSSHILQNRILIDLELGFEYHWHLNTYKYGHNSVNTIHQTSAMEFDPLSKLSLPDKFVDENSLAESVTSSSAEVIVDMVSSLEIFRPPSNSLSLNSQRPQQQNNCETLIFHHHHYHQSPSNPIRSGIAHNFNGRSQQPIQNNGKNPSFFNHPTFHHYHNYHRPPNPKGRDSNPYRFNNFTGVHQPIIQNRSPQFNNTTTIYYNGNPSSSLNQFGMPLPPPLPVGFIPGRAPMGYSAPKYGFSIYGGDAETFSWPRGLNFSNLPILHPNALPQTTWEFPNASPVLPLVQEIHATPLLLAEIRNQIHYYFSDINLCKDYFLRKHMDSEGWVDIHLIAGFNLIVAKTDNLDVIREALHSSNSVELQGDRLRKRSGWNRWILQ